MPYPVFLINLDRQSERLQFMLRQLQQLGIEAVRIRAFDGRAPDALARSSVASYAPLTAGEIGCFESHRDAWGRVLAEGLQGAIVLEDDVIVSNDFAVLDFSAVIEEGCDLLKIDQQLDGIDIDDQNILGTRMVAVGPSRAASRLLGGDLCTGCYFVTRNGAERLLKASKDYFVPVDRYMFDGESKVFWSLNVWKLRPSAAQQRQSSTQAQGQNGTDDSISSARATGVDRPRAFEVWHAWAMRLRRLREWDMRWVRSRRIARNLALFESKEQVERVVVPFSGGESRQV